MYNKFMEFMSNFLDKDASQDFWYDVASEDASKLLMRFSESDWSELSQNIEIQPIEFKRKLAYCLNEGDNINQLRLLIVLLNTSDDELFTMCIDALRSFSILEGDSINSEMIKRIESIMLDAGDATKLVLGDFLKKYSD